jgi:hypothetical protein
MRLYCTHFNFCRGYRGLTKEKEKGVLGKKTPAEECGITNLTTSIKARRLKKIQGS